MQLVFRQPLSMVTTLIATLWLSACHANEPDQTHTSTPPKRAVELSQLDCRSDRKDLNALAEQLLNQRRSQPRFCGNQFADAAAPLTYNPILYNAAYRYSRRMAVENFFSHIDPDGNSHGHRLDAEGYDWLSSGENLASGQRTLAEVMAAWLESPGHCRNIMGMEFREFGLACVKTSENNDAQASQTYWTLLLGLRRQ